MPQMAPMMWMTSLTMMTLIMIMTMSTTYFFKKNIKLFSKKSSEHISTWKW